MASGYIWIACHFGTTGDPVRTAFIAASIALGALLSTPTASHSQVTLVAAALAGKQVSKIIADLKLAAVNLLNQADNTGNAMISHAANEANVLAQNLSFQFRDRLDQTFDRLDDDEKKLLLEAEAMRTSLTQVVDKAYDAKDTLAVDLNRLLDRFPFLTKGFFLQSVRGIAYFPGAGDYKLKVTASTLGIDELMKTNVTMTIDGKPVNDLQVDQSLQRGQAIITVPNSLISPKFSDNDLVLVKAVVTFKVERNRGVWPFKWTSKEGPFEVPLTISLYPRTAATVTPTARAPVYTWTPAGSMAISKDTPDRHCDRDCGGERTRGPNRIEMTVAGGDVQSVGYKRFVGTPSLQCTGGGSACGYAGAQNTYITENATRAVATWDTWSRPTTWTLTTAVEEYKMTADSPYTGESMKVLFGQPVILDYPKASTAKAIKIKTFTKNEYTILTGIADPKQIMSYQGMEANAPPKVDRLLYQVKMPEGVQ